MKDKASYRCKALTLGGKVRPRSSVLMQSWEPWGIWSREETLRNRHWEVDLGVFADRLGLPASFVSLLDCAWGEGEGEGQSL